MSDSAGRRVFDILSSHGVLPTPLTSIETWALLRSWRRNFVPEVEEATGHAVHLGYEWHAFSYKFCDALQGNEAVAAYSLQPARAFFVLSAWSGVTFGFRCTGAPPDLIGRKWDVIVTPTDFRWSMVFTHEQSLGPYFQTKTNSLT